MMKKILICMFSLLIGITFAAIPTYAESLSSADIGTYAATTTEALREGYEGTVIARMIGRSGSKAPYGAKGISFEVLYSDKLNLKNIGKNCVTKLSDSSIDQLADLITYSDDTIVEYIQCKNVLSDAGVEMVVGQLLENHYPGASIVTTSESAAKITARLEELGVEASVVDSGIDHAVTVRIADKCKGIISPKAIEELSKHSTSFAAGVASVFALYESIKNDDDIGETVANVSTSAGKAATSMLAATTVSEIAGATAATLGASGAVQVVVPMVIVVGVGAGVEYGLDKIFEFAGVEDTIAAATNSICETVKEQAIAFSGKVSDMNIKGRFANAKDFVASKVGSAKVAICSVPKKVACASGK